MVKGKGTYVKRVLLLCLMLLLIGTAVAVSGCKKAPEQKAQEALPVITAPVQAMDITYELHRVGTLEANDSVLLKSEADGRVLDIFFEEGDWIVKGQKLVKIDDAKIRTTMDQLNARFRQTDIELANSLKTLRRKQPLVEKDLVSQQEYDDLLASIEIQKATVTEIKAQLAHNQELLEDTELRAPFAGFTSERQVSIGDLVRPGDPIVQLVQLDPLEISFQADEKYKQRLYPHQQVSLSVAAYPDRIFQGEVFFISPDIDINTRTFLVKGRVANTEHLLNPGMFAEITIITETHTNALVVPWDSVVQLENEIYVYALNSALAHKIPVTLGQVTGQQAEVFGDLRPGQLVVTDGKYALKDGVPVKIITAPAGKN